MSSITRRNLLTGLAAASTAAATVVTTASATTIENRELIRLAEELAEVEARYVAADEWQKHLVAEWKPQWPLAPDEITSPGRKGMWSGFERGFEGGALYRKGEEEPRQLIGSDWFSGRAKRARRALKRGLEGERRQEWEAELAEAERGYAVAVRYEAEIARIKEASDYEAAWRNTAAMAEVFEAHVAAIMDQPDFTMEGLLIKAQALAAWGRVEGLYKLAFRHGQDWPGQIAASILRHAEKSTG